MGSAHIVKTWKGLLFRSTLIVGLAFAALHSDPGAHAQEDGLGGSAAKDAADVAADAEGDPDPSTRVVNGTPARHADWPSLVTLRMVNPQGHTFMCGGTVIAPGWVLTAGHCVKGFDAAKMTVIEGIASQSQAGHRLGVREALLHEGYTSSPEPHDDVALLHLAGITTSPPQRLISEQAALSMIRDGAAGEVAGFGLTTPQRNGANHSGQVSKRLLQAKLPLVGQEACRRLLGRAMGTSGIDKVVDETTVCAGDVKGGKDTCAGDSGGPLSLDVSRNLRVQIGVISWGPGCAQPDTVGVYTSVGHFEDWIKDHVPQAMFYDVGLPPVSPSLPHPAGVASPPPESAQVLEQEAQSLGANAGLRVGIVEGVSVHVGESIHVDVSSTLAGQLVVYNVDETNGAVYQVYPNSYAAKPDTVLTKGGEVTIPGPADDFTIEVRAPLGANRLYAFVVPPGDGVTAVAARGMDMKTLPDPKGVVEEFDRAVVVVPRPHAAIDRASASFDYEILP